MTTSRIFSLLLGVILIITAVIGIYYGMRSVWIALTNADDKVAISIIAGFFSVIGATITVMLGRYYERKREIEAHFREKKIQIYDDFLKELFKEFHGSDEGTEEMGGSHLVDFLREWQRTLVLWGGKNVLKTYFSWMTHLKKGKPNAQTLYLMDDFFRALRSDIGQSSSGLERGAFTHLILRNSELFLEHAKQNPSLTFEEFSQLEKQLGIDG